MRKQLTFFLAIVLLAAACAPSVPARPSDRAAQPTGARDRSRVVIAIWAEIESLATKLGRTSTYGPDYSYVVNSPLVAVEAAEGPQPRLAAELPSGDRSTWAVSADGTMATTWKIRPNAVWHDGQPITSGDFVFAFRVYMDQEMVIDNTSVERLIDRIESIDDKTFVIHWKQIYPWANQLKIGQMEPLPAHLVGALYESGDKTAFQNAPFWSSAAYVGSGPFRIAEWVQGSQLRYRAFDQYYLGRPKLDEVVFQITPDANTVVAYLLSAAVDVTVNTTMNQAAWLNVKQDWDRNGEGHIISILHHLRATQFQLDPARNKQPAILDVRGRRALVHALDRAAIADAVSNGASPVADAMITPSEPLYRRVQPLIATYPYDPGRAQTLLGELGWTKRGEQLVNARGEQFAIDIMTTQIADNLTEQRIMADYYSRLGMEVTQTPVPEARNRDAEYRATFPALTITGQTIDLPSSMRVYSRDECPTAERRFRGNNRGCWLDTDFERLFRTAMTTLDEEERASSIAGALKRLTEDVAVIPMSYNLDNVAVRKGLRGPGPRPGEGADTWNIHEWQWQ